MGRVGRKWRARQLPRSWLKDKVIHNKKGLKERKRSRWANNITEENQTSLTMGEGLKKRETALAKR